MDGKDEDQEQRKLDGKLLPGSVEDLGPKGIDRHVSNQRKREQYRKIKKDLSCPQQDHPDAGKQTEESRLRKTEDVEEHHWSENHRSNYYQIKNPFHLYSFLFRI
ncbi:MAG: hypothetical protein ABID54_00225 [Pseudomonadota bacterium]